MNGVEIGEECLELFLKEQLTFNAEVVKILTVLNLNIEKIKKSVEQTQNCILAISMNDLD